MDAFLPKMEGPRVDLGSLLGRQGALKSQFSVKDPNKFAKKSIQEGFQKKHEKMMQNLCKNGGTNTIKTLTFAALYNSFEGFGVLQKQRKMKPKWSKI